MATHKLITNGSFGKPETEAMSAAYESALVDLGITNRDDPITDQIARAIVYLVTTGERDPKLIEQRAINALGIRRRCRIDPHYRKFFRDRRAKLFRSTF